MLPCDDLLFMSPIEEATTTELLEELARRSTSMICGLVLHTEKGPVFGGIIHGASAHRVEIINRLIDDNRRIK